MINRTKHQLTSNMVVTSLGPDHCDLHILEQLSEDNQEESEESRLEGIMKIEGNDESTSADEDMEMENEDDKNFIDFVENPVKYESAPFQCACCWEEFVHEHAYMQHMSKHVQQGDGDGECETSQVCKPHTAVSSSSAHSALSTENKQADFSPSAHSTQTLVAPLPASLATNNEIQVPPTEEADTNVSCRYNRLTDCFVKLYDVFSKKVVPRQDGKAVVLRSCVSQNIASKDTGSQATSENEVSTTEYVEPVTNKVKLIESKTLQNKTDCLKKVIDIQCLLQSSSHTEGKGFICDICRKVFRRKRLLVKHIKTHAEVRWLTCKICQYKCKYQSHLKRHMRTHTGDKPYSCKICEYKCAHRSNLMNHTKIHHGIKNFSCKLCDYKSAHNSNLVKHMRTHTGEKPYSCEICEYKCSLRGSLMKHMRIHTGIKPFTCKICHYKCVQNGTLVSHMRTHTGEKPYSCKICEFKCAHSTSLMKHMRIHTGIKPFMCKICHYKCAHNGNLVTHMRTHTGDQPYSCGICEYKCSQSSNLMQHMRIHTGIKNYLCKLCDYKCAHNSNLVTHMRTHTGEKPYSCKMCEFKCAQSSSLMRHMRAHTAAGETPSSSS